MKRIHLASRSSRAISNADTPRSGDVVFEIGLTLALHLAFALAVVLTLTAYGIA